ncbi:hypothetical protein EV426DRAFT_74855 [Tirmania nivea]|nr:hypothetical protein EV426DRAFT_74855 [Tirmania nivea]
MATYTPKKPYGSRWNFRTPSPPPSSVIEPISPVEIKHDSTIIFPNPSTVPNPDAIEYQSNPLRHSSHEEPRSDSTLSLLSSVSPPSGSSSRRHSPNTMGRSIGSSEVPTFAGNQYWDPLAFFADVALSSADPTTLPKLQKLAAKDAAQRMEASPADVSPPRSAPEAPQNGQTPTFTVEHISRRFSTGAENSSPPRYFLPPVSGILPQFGPGQLSHTAFYRSTNIAAGSPVESERIDLAPIRDMTPPSSNASITGNIETRSSSNQLLNGPSVSPHPKAAILPSPPLAIYTGAQQASDLFSDFPAKRSKTTSQHNRLSFTNAEAVESSTNTERLSSVTAKEEDTITVEQPTRTQKGKRRGRGGKAVATRVDTITPVKRDVPKTKKGRIAMPTSSIAVRRSTRNIRYIEEPEDHIITRPPAKIEPQHEHGKKQHSNPQRIVLHIARNHISSTTKAGVSPTAGNNAETTAYSQNITEQFNESRAGTTLPPTAQLTSLSSQELEDLNTPGLESNTAGHGTPTKGDTTLAFPQIDISKEQKNRDSDVMSIVDRVQKQLMLNSDSGSIPGHSKSRVDKIASHSPDQSKHLITPGSTLGHNIFREHMYSANLHLDRNEGVSGLADSASLATYNRKTSIDAQAIVDALQQAPLPPLSSPPVLMSRSAQPQPSRQQSPRRQSPRRQSLPLMGMSARQLWGELKSGKEPAVPADTLIEEIQAHSVRLQPLEHTDLDNKKLIDEEDEVTSKPNEAERMEIDKEEAADEDVSLEASQQPAVEIIDAHEPAIAKSLEELVEAEEPGLGRHQRKPTHLWNGKSLLPPSLRKNLLQRVRASLLRFSLALRMLLRCR